MTAGVVRIRDCTLYLGDCLELLMSPLAFDSVLTDPPYGIDYKSGHATDELWKAGKTIASDTTVQVRDSAIALCGDVPKLVFGSERAAKPPGTRMTLVWDKGPALGMGALDLPWKPGSERIFVLGKGFAGTRDSGDVLYHPPVQSMAKNGRQHPTEKPVGLLQLLLRKLPGVVCDPFMGSGSTGVACAKMGRAFVGIELTPQYFEIACSRIEEAYKQPDMFVETTKPMKQESMQL